MTAQFSSDLPQLDRIDWTILNNRDFSADPDDPGKKERYQAEALVYRHLPVAALTGIACHGPDQETRLKAIMNDVGISLPVAVRPGWYFS